MGDRGNIVVQHAGEGQVWLYTHWSGSEIVDIARASLARGKDRWDDPAYLARIVFQTLVGDDQGTTGFGISTCLTDNEHAVVVIDTANRTVAAHEQAGRTYKDQPIWTKSIREFVEDGAPEMTDA